MLQKFNLLVLFLFFTSCTHKSKDDVYFENYLQKNFNKKIESKKCKYVLVASNGCRGCNNFVLNIAKINNDSNTIYIFSDIYKAQFNIKQPNNVWLDKSENINKLKFHKGAICKLYTNEGEIDSIKIYDINSIKFISTED